MPRAPEAPWTMPESTPSRLLRDLLPCMALLVSIKVAWLLLDPTVRLFLGDSGSYLHTALSGWIPPDRSFLYGWLIEATAVRFHSAYALLLTQSLFGIVGGMLLYLWLVAGLKLSRVPALLAAALFASDPAQLFYERMMMAEAVGLLAFLLFFVALSGYVATRRALLIPVYAVLGVTAVAFRINLLAVVLTLSVLAPLITAFGKWRDGASRVRAIGIGFAHLVLSLACTSYAHGYYKQWYAELTATDPGDLYTDHPGYTAQSGVFRLALVAPLIEPAHFRNTGVSPDVLREVTLDYRDPRLREAQIWTEGGLYDVLQRHSDDPDRVARKISIRAAREHPIGLLQLGLLTVLDYFDPAVAAPRLQDDLGRRAPSAELVADLREHLRYDVAGVHTRDTPALRWFEWGSKWLVACLFGLAPLALLVFWRGRHAPRFELRLLLALTSLGLVAGHVLFSHIVSFRYLHPLPWFVLANLAVLLQDRFDRRGSA